MNKVRSFLLKDKNTITVSESIIFAILFAVIKVVLTVISTELMVLIYQKIEEFRTRKQEQNNPWTTV